MGLRIIKPVMLWIILLVNNPRWRWLFFIENKQRMLVNLSVAIVRTIDHCLHDPTVRERVKRKFDISYLLAKENLLFTKYSPIHELLGDFLTRQENQLTISHATLLKV